MRRKIGYCLICATLLLQFLTGCEQAPTKMIEPKTSRVDYLTLRVGKSWTYEFSYNFRQAGLWDSTLNGSLAWIVRSADTLDNPKQYRVSAILSGQAIKFDHRYGTTDTTVILPDTSSFFILEDATSALAIMPAFFDSQIQFSDSLKRYAAEHSADTLSFRFANRHPVESISFVKGRGIIMWSFSRTGNSGAAGSMKLKK